MPVLVYSVFTGDDCGAHFYTESVLILTKSSAVVSERLNVFDYFVALNAFDYVATASSPSTALRAPTGSIQARSQLKGSRGWQPNSQRSSTRVAT